MNHCSAIGQLIVAMIFSFLENFQRSPLKVTLADLLFLTFGTSYTSNENWQEE